jgi:hypothetical protein
MTPTEAYEARKAARKKIKDMDYQLQTRTETLDLLDTVDRLAVAFERIADALERQYATTMPSGQPLFTAGMSENGVD